MSILFFPQGMPLSSSVAQNAGYTHNTSVGGFPVTASVAEYVINYIGPTGPVYVTTNTVTIV